MCKWMTCNSCRAVVQLNSTGICLGCQGGFAGQQQEDKYIPEEEKIQKLKARERELEDAIKEREKSEDNKLEHTQRDGSGKTSKAGGSNRSKRSRKKQKEEE